MEDDKKLLREYVKTLLKEDDTGGAGLGGYGGDSSGGMNSWGMGMMNYGPSLKSWAIDPFLDVGKIFKASAMKLTTRVKTLFKVVLETALTTAIPFLQSNYTLIFQQEKQELARIKEKYKEAFTAVDKAFNEDVMILSFMISPTAFISAKAAAKSPQAILSTLEVFAHGSENMAKYVEDIRKRLEQIHKDLTDDIDKYKLDAKGAMVPKNQRGPYLTQKKRAMFKSAGIMDALEFDDDFIFEQPYQPAQAPQPSQGNEQQQVEAFMQQVLSDPNLKQMIASSPFAKQMQQDANRVANDLSNKLLAEATKVMSIKSAQDLQKLVKKPLGIEKLTTLQPQERQQAEQALITQAKAAMKQFYVKSLEQEINNTMQRGVDPNNLYIVTLKNTMSKIGSLK